MLRGEHITLYGWDASHYDGALTTAVMTRAAAEGIQFFTHKLGEGLANTDPTAATALAAAKAARIPVIGGYWFVHGNDDPKAEAARCVATADAGEPWWRTFPGWFWQCDAETSPTGLPSPAYVKTFADTLAGLTGRTVIVYASHGMYGNTLTGLDHPLWNANYPTSRPGTFKALYPGDTYPGWAPYSGQTPALCQYTSSAIIAGLTTCDANAFRGSVEELLTLIGADMTTTAFDVWGLTPPAGVTNPTDIVRNPKQRPDSPLHTPPGKNATTITGFALGDLWQVAYDGRDAAVLATVMLAGIVKSEAVLQATLSQVLAGGTSVDTAVLAAQIKAIGDAESAAVAGLLDRIAELETRLAAAGTALGS